MLPDGSAVSGKRWLANALWELVTTLQVTMPDGTTLKPEPEGWFNVVKFIYGQIDGPPKQQIGVDFTTMTDAQLAQFIESGLANICGGDSGSAAPESARPDTAEGGAVPVIRSQG